MKTENLHSNLLNNSLTMKTTNQQFKLQNSALQNTPLREKSSGHSSDVKSVYKSAQETDKIELRNNATKTTAGVNPSGRLSFKGGPIPVTFAEKLVKNNLFNKFLDVICDNSLVADALIALFLTAVLRPASIYSFPTKDPVEKKKNNYQVGHSAATGFLGLGTTLVVAQPVKKAVAALMAAPEKYMKTDASYIMKYDKGRVFRETANRIHQPLFLPLRAALTIALVKPILNAIGLSKPSKSIAPADKAKIDYSFMSFKGDDSKTFKGFTKIGAKFDAPKAQKMSNSAKNVAFKGLSLGAVKKLAQKADAQTTEVLAQGIGKVADTNVFKKLIKKIGECKNYFPHLIAAESIWLSGFYMERTARSKTIEKDQKLPMILNQGITAALCTWGAYKLDGPIKAKLGKLADVYKRMNPELDEKLLNNRMFAISKLLGPLVIFTTIYRFIGPVVVTPVANKLSEFIQPHKKDKAA